MRRANEVLASLGLFWLDDPGRHSNFNKTRDIPMVFGPSDTEIAGNLTDLRNFFTHYGEPGQASPDAKRIRRGLIMSRCLFETVVLYKLSAPESATKAALTWARDQIDWMR